MSCKKLDPLQRTIPKNPRYVNVKPTIDTGASISKHLSKIEEMRQDYKKKNGEIFRRLKASTFVQLIIQVAELNSNMYIQEDFETDNRCLESNERDDDNEITPRNIGTSSTVNTNRSTLESLVKGVGEHDVAYSSCHLPPLSTRRSTIEENNLQLNYNASTEGRNINIGTDQHQPYLILDVRDRDEFEQCHIIKALSYPMAMLSRSINFETGEMLAYKNRSGHIILLYDDDERIAPRAATTLVERGYDNVFLLAGGLKVAWKLFPKGLIIGEIPASVQQAVSTAAGYPVHLLPIKKTSSQASTAAAGNADVASKIGSSHGSRASTANSMASGMTARSVMSTASARSSVSSALSSTGSSNVSRTSRRGLGGRPTIYCEVGSRGQPGQLNNGEEFTMQDLAQLSLTLERMGGGDNVSTHGSIRSTTSSLTSRSVTSSDSKKPFR